MTQNKSIYIINFINLMKKEEIIELIESLDCPSLENQSLENLEMFWAEVARIADIIVDIHNKQLKRVCKLQKENCAHYYICNYSQYESNAECILNTPEPNFDEI